VIVTTKKGRKDGSAQVAVDGYTAFQSRPKEYKVLNAFDWGTLANQVADADPAHNFIEMPIWRTPDALHNLDWQNALYGSSLTQNYTVGIRGGSEKVQSAFALGYYNQKGIVEGSYFKRLTGSANLDYTANRWIKSSTSVKYAYQDANNPFGTGSLVQLSELPPTMDNGNPATPLIKDGKGNYGFYNPNETYVAKYNNPVFGLETNQYKNITNYLLINSSLEVTLYDGLKIKTMAGVNTTNYSGSYYQPEDDRIHALFPSAIQGNALYSQHLNSTFEWVWENTLSYDKTFGKHAIHFVGGLSAQKTTRNFMGGQGIPPNSVIRDLSQVTNLQLDTYSPTGLGNPGNGQTIYTLASEFGRINYGFADKYFITGTLRRDGSSKFDVGHQYGVFPSGAALWKIKNESFLENVGWLSNLSFRGSYGEVGNEGSIPLFQYLALFGTGGPASLNGGGADNLGYPFDKLYQGGIAQIIPANPNLKWETDYQTDIGADAAFLNGALTVTADYYDRRSKDFLLNIASPAQSGFLVTTRNVGSMDNKGIELALNYHGNKGRDFQYGIGVTFASNKNTLTSLTNGTTFITNFGGTSGNPNQAFAPTGLGWSTFTETNIGQPVGEFYGYKTLGIFQTQAQINALNLAAQNAKVSAPYYQKAVNLPGDRYFADVNKDGHVDATDQVSLGSPQPKFFGGVNLDASYKGWDINLYFYGVYGNKIDNYVESSLESFQNRGFTGVENVSQAYYKDRWTPTNPSNRYARATYNDDAVGSNVPSSTWIENGSFLKLKNMTIGYTLPASMIRAAYLTKVRFYVSSQNLFTITKYSGLDPEIGLQNGNATQAGVDNGVYPSSRYFTVGLNVTF
jgi:TonB-linked SusC/RagA family outer membrane protein